MDFDELASWEGRENKIRPYPGVRDGGDVVPELCGPLNEYNEPFRCIDYSLVDPW